MCLQSDNNDIGPEGCKHLAPALAECTALTTLQLVRYMNTYMNVLREMLGVLVSPKQCAMHGGGCVMMQGFDLNSHVRELNLPAEAASGDDLRILQFLRDRDGGHPEAPHPSTTTVVRAKLMVVGHGAAGKTTLIHRLRTGLFKTDFPVTDGVDVGQLSMTVEGVGPLYIDALWGHYVCIYNEYILHKIHLYRGGTSPIYACL